MRKYGVCAVGVATGDLRNKTNNHDHQNSLCFSLNDGMIWEAGKTLFVPNFREVEFSIIHIRRNKDLIDVTNNGIPYCNLNIPSRLSEAAIFPVCWFKNSANVM